MVKDIFFPELQEKELLPGDYSNKAIITGLIEAERQAKGEIDEHSKQTPGLWKK